MDVATGEYELTTRLDLSPVFGVLEHTRTVQLTKPDADLLDRRLEELASEDANVRRQALIDLRYFPGEGERVAPALVARAKDPDANVRTIALSVLMAYQPEAAEHVDLFLAVLVEGETVGERANAAHLLSRVAPAEDRFKAALTHAAETEEGNYQPRFTSALANYLRRTETEPPDAR